MEHGTFGAYDHAGCRCGECRAWMAAYRRYKRGTQVAVITYDEGEPRTRRAYISRFGSVRNRRNPIQITQQGREYLAALRAEGVARA